MKCDVLVVGAGVVGLVSAKMLADAGARVILLDRAVAGKEASWAGGGIVSPLYPWRYSPAVTALASWSQDFYPQLGAQLAALTGIDPEVRATGLYWLDLDDKAQALSWSRQEAKGLESLAMASVRQRLPCLGKGFSDALFMAGVANVRNPRLVRALRAALLGMPNVMVREHSEVVGFLARGARIRGVKTLEGELYADRIVVAAGAWSAQLLATLGLELAVMPVKGQMILYRCGEDFLQSMVLAKGRYAIPRQDGHILVGSTLEFEGFDKAPTDIALESLKASAVELLPALSDAEVRGHWAGLRPGSPDGVPFIGPVPGFEGLWLNCGHYRNGLVLAPASCRLLTDLLQGNPPIIDPVPFAPFASM